MCGDLTLEANEVDTPDNIVSNDQNLAGWQAKYDLIMAEYSAAEVELATPVVPPPGAVNNDQTQLRATRPRANDPLKPNPLAQDSKPSELRAWKKRFKVFYESHVVNKMPLLEKHAHFLTCLSKTAWLVFAQLILH